MSASTGAGRRRTRSRVAAALAVLGLLAACGEDGDDGAGAGGADAGATTALSSQAGTVASSEAPSDGPAAGEPIKVMVLGQFDAPALGFAFPATRAVVEAHFADVNLGAGIGGRPVEVLACNDAGDANQAANCAREAVAEGVVAVIAGFTLYGTQVLPILEEAGVALVGGSILGPAEGTSPVNFPLESGAPLAGIASAESVVAAGCSTVGVVAFDSPASQVVVDWLEGALTAAGATSVVARVPETGIPSYASQVATVVGDGAECVVPVLSPGETAKLVNALHQSGEELMVSAPAAVIYAVLETLGELADGYLVTSSLLLPTDTDEPGIRRMLDVTEAHAPGTVLDPTAVGSYAGAVLLEQALLDVSGDVTAASVLDALGSLTDVDTGVTPLISTQPTGIEGFERLFNTGVITYEVQGGELVRTGDFLDVKDRLVELAG